MHDRDYERYDPPEAPGLDALLRGLALHAADDDQLIAMTEPLYDPLYDLWSQAP
ncbi:MAG: chromate resistance protein ChrB domain-containing protein [Solirubrobacterales bacterium]